MSAPTYIYPGSPSAAAALHLLDGTALQWATEREHTHHAHADCIRVTITSPRLSTGEQVLWDALDALAREDGGVDVQAAAQWLDADNLRVLHEALGMRWALTNEVTA